MIYLVEMVAAIDAAGTTTTLRATTAPFFATAPTDTPASALYLPRLKTAGLFRRDMASPGRLFGATSVGYGLVELANADGGLDPWLDYAFDGRAITILVGDDDDGYAEFVPVLVGVMDQPTATLSSLSIRIRDRLHELDKPLLTTRYLGNNALPAGLEGVEDLAGKVKPRAYGGIAQNIAPPLVNTSRLIYQVSDRAYSALQVRDQGVLLTAGADYTSQSDMETTAPSAGQVRGWPAGGMFRLGSTPAGRITANVTDAYSSAYEITPAGLIESVALDAGIAASDIDAADLAALSAAATYSVEAWVDDERTALEVLDTVAESGGIWYGFDALGKLRMGQIAAPPATPDLTIGAYQVITAERIASDDALPVWQIKYNYGRNYSVMSDAEIAGSVGPADRAYYKMPSNATTKSDAAIKSRHLLARDIVIDSTQWFGSAAGTEANRLLSLLKVDRGFYTVRARVTPALIAQAELGATVTADIDRFGLADKICLVTGLLVDPLRNEIELTLWG